MYDYNDNAPTNQYPPSEIPDAGGYDVFAIMDDGGTLCRSCVLDPTNPVHDDRARPFGTNNDGWGVVGWAHTGEVEEVEYCDHCGKVIVEHESVWREGTGRPCLRCAAVGRFTWMDDDGTCRRSDTH